MLADNPVVSYKQVACPATLANDYKQCECAGPVSRVRRGEEGRQADSIE